MGVPIVMPTIVRAIMETAFTLPETIISTLGAIIRNVKTDLFISCDNHWRREGQHQPAGSAFYFFTLLPFYFSKRFLPFYSFTFLLFKGAFYFFTLLPFYFSKAPFYFSCSFRVCGRTRLSTTPTTAAKPMPEMAKLPDDSTAPPRPMVSITEAIITLRVSFMSTRCCIRF